jgi:uncharacterized phiE125 gp8 family phage protein
MGLTLKTAPASEPVSLAEAKTHLRVEHTDEDTYISALITAARAWCEKRQNRAYVTQTWTYTLNGFPLGRIYLPKGRLQSVTSVKYTDSDGDTTTLSNPDDYLVSTSEVLGFVTPAYGESWPSDILYPVDPIAIEFICGYGVAAAVPESIKLAIKLLVSQWYDNRAPLNPPGTVGEAPFAVTALLASDRIIQV